MLAAVWTTSRPMIRRSRIVVKLLAKVGAFIPPKMSVSLLAGQDGAVNLAGYGRLGPDDFSLIEPRSDRG